MSIDGNVTIQGSVSAKGSAEVQGSINVQGSVNAQGDITTGTVSLQTHTHSGDSGGMTGVPNDKNTGRYCENESVHLRQSIADILLTPIGTRIQRRDYGSYIF